jgi:hypothetical protein
VVLGRCEQVISDFNSVSDELNRRFGSDFKTLADQEKAGRWALEKIRQSGALKDDPFRIPAPVQLRGQLVLEVRPRVAENPRVQKALRLYESLLSRTGQGKI